MYRVVLEKARREMAWRRATDLIYNSAVVADGNWR